MNICKFFKSFLVVISYEENKNLNDKVIKKRK